VKRDLRKDEPYLCYADNWDGQGAKAVEFKVPLAEAATPTAAAVRIEECAVGEIIKQLIDNIPQGPVDVFVDEKMTKPSKSDVYGSIEGLIQHFELIMTNRGWKAPVAEIYGGTETANGEQGFYIVSNGGPRAWRARCRPPSFINYQTFGLMLEGHQISDAVAVLGSLNIIAAELDR
jgi:NADH-quinone oxidoreductase subunit D